MTESKAVVHRSLTLEGTDLEVHAVLANATLTVEVKKSSVCVHRLVVDDATDCLAHGWITDLFAREDHVQMRELAGQVDDYVSNLDTNQG